MKKAVLHAALLGASALAAGCSTMSEVQPIGEGRFMVGNSVQGGFTSDAEVKSRALDRARAHCAASGKQLNVVSTRSSGTQGWTPQNSEVVFKCDGP